MCETEDNLKGGPRLIESRNLAHKLFSQPEIREKWTAELGGTLEFEPVATEDGLVATLRAERVRGDLSPAQTHVRLAQGEVTTLGGSEGRFTARGGEGVEFSWSTTSRVAFDPMMPSLECKHTDVQLSGPGWSRSLEQQENGLESPFQWAPVVRDGRTVVQISERRIECLDQEGNKVFAHEGTPWSGYSLPPVIGADGRVVIFDKNHNHLTGYLPDGATAWERSFYSKNVRCTPLPLEHGHTLVAVQSEKNGETSLQRLNDNGDTVEEWRIPGSFVAGMTLAPDGTLLVATNDSPRLCGYDEAGQLRWEHPLAEPTLGAPRVQADGSLMVVGQNGHVTVLEVSDPRTSSEAPPVERYAGEVQEGPDFVNVAGVRLRRK